MTSHLGTILVCSVFFTGCSPFTVSNPESYTPGPAPDVKPNEPLSEESASKIYIEKGVHYMEAGEYQIALKDFERAVEIDDDNPDAYNALGVLYGKLGEVTHADTSFKKAISLKSDYFAARNNYGRFLCSHGRHTEAFAQFEQVIGNRLYPQPWIPLTNAGLCAKSIGKKSEAERYLRQALEHDPQFSPALLEMARLSQENGQYMTARAFLQRTLSSSGPTPDSLQLGIAIENALGNPQMVEEYETTLKTMRKHPSP